jgi:hypothetical protein
MVGDGDMNVNVYQPGTFESPIHEALQRLSHFLVILSIPTENAIAMDEDKDSLRTATDNITWSEDSQVGFVVEVMKYRQENILPLLEEVPNQWATN